MGTRILHEGHCGGCKKKLEGKGHKIKQSNAAMQLTIEYDLCSRCYRGLLNAAILVKQGE